MKLKVVILGVAAMAAIPVARGDTLSLAQVTSEISSSSPLKLRDDVAQDFAENLLAAQLPGVCLYCANEPDSLSLSIAALIRAISLDKRLNKDHYCDDSNCSISWGQSLIAIDDRTIPPVITSAVMIEEPVSTPEPSILLLVLAGLGLIKGRKRNG